MSDEVTIYSKDIITELTTFIINANASLIAANQQKSEANDGVISMKQGYILFCFFAISFNRCLLEFISKKLEPMNA